MMKFWRENVWAAGAVTLIQLLVGYQWITAGCRRRHECWTLRIGSLRPELQLKGKYDKGAFSLEAPLSHHSFI
jgi:hypothetical protein